MKRYKFQALVTPYPDEDAREKLGSGSHRDLAAGVTEASERFLRLCET
jgi:hypothetical protein